MERGVSRGVIPCGLVKGLSVSMTTFWGLSLGEWCPSEVLSSFRDLWIFTVVSRPSRLCVCVCVCVCVLMINLYDVAANLETMQVNIQNETLYTPVKTWE